VYVNRTIISGRLTEDPIYKSRHGSQGEEYCMLKCHTEKPIKVKEVRQREDVYFEVIAFGNNASSIKNMVFKGTPLLFELEIRNIDQGDGRPTMVLQAVKIHFMEKPSRRIDMDRGFNTQREVQPKQEEVKKEEVDGNIKKEAVEVAADVLTRETQSVEVIQEKSKKTKKRK